MTTEENNLIRETRSSTAATHIWPFSSEKDTIKAAEQYISLKTSPSNRRKIFERLLISDDYFPAIAPLIMSSFHRMETPTRHIFLDHIISLIIKGKEKEFVDIVGNIAKMMGDNNYKLREKAGDLLLHMGESAAPATVRLLPLLRSKISDIQLKALLVFSSIGPCCAKQALPRIELLLKSNVTAEVKKAAEQAKKILNGEEKPFRPEIKIEGVIDSDNIISTSEEDTQEEDDSAKSTIAMTYPAIKDKVIVIADDEEAIRSMIGKALRTCGAKTKESSDGKALLRLIEAKIDIDLFILDLMMPKITGSEVLNALRNSPFYTNTPVIIVSAKTERSILFEMSSMEIAAYFTKPFKLTDILNLVNLTLAQE